MGKQHVLFVDDSPDERALDLMAVKASGVDTEVTVLCSGEESLDYIACRGKYADRDKYSVPNVVFLDIHLGKMRGFEVLHVIRLDLFWRWVPVVMFSTSSAESDIRLAYEKGANGYLVKATDLTGEKDRATIVLRYWLELNRVIAREGS